MDLKKLLIKYRELISYIFWGVATTVLNYATYFICTELLHINYLASNVISWLIAVLFAFYVNKLLVFKSFNWQWKVVFPELWKFISARILSGILETGLLFVFVDCLDFNDAPIKLIAGILVVLLNYIISKLLIFKTKKERAD